MGKRVYNPQKKCKVISITALASYMGYHRHTIAKKIKQEGVDLCNIYSLLDFVKKYAPNSTTD